MRTLIFALAIANALALYWNVQAHRRDAQITPPPKPVPSARSDQVTSLLLLSEVDTAELRERGAEPAPAPAARVEQSPADEASNEEPATTCVSLGPITDDEQLSTLEQGIEEEGLQMQRREGKRRELTRYWVYLPPFATKDAARATVKRLQDQGVSDLHIIHRGDMANALSLGVYGREASMQRRVQMLAAAGVTAKVAERHRVQKSTWLDVTLPAGSDINLDSVKTALKLDDVGTAPCPKLLRASALPKIPGAQSAPGVATASPAAPPGQTSTPEATPGSSSPSAPQ